MYDVADTIAAIASAPGGSERGIVRVAGPRTVDCLTRHFNGSLDLDSARAQCWPGKWQLDESGRQIDCQLYLWPTSRSYPRQPTAELHLPGSPPILQRVLRQVCATAARLAHPGEFTLRAFLAGRLDLPQAEAVLAVIDAKDQRHLQRALNQLAGGLSGQLNQLRSQLLNLIADIEAGLDFVEEDIQFVSSAEIARQLTSAEQSLTELVLQIRTRQRSESAPRVVLRGARTSARVPSGTPSSVATAPSCRPSPVRPATTWKDRLAWPIKRAASSIRQGLTSACPWRWTSPPSGWRIGFTPRRIWWSCVWTAARHSKFGTGKK